MAENDEALAVRIFCYHDDGVSIATVSLINVWKYFNCIRSQS